MTPADFRRQKRLLQSLGFACVEEPAPLREGPAGNAPAGKARKVAPAKAPAPPPQPARPAIVASAPAASLQDAPARNAALGDLAAAVRACVACPLHAARGCAVPGEGPAGAALMVIGEVPSAEDDRSGRPFDGASGELMAKMIAAMGFDRPAIFATHAVKCRTLNGRSPHAAELEACRAYLHRQAAIVAPRAIICFGPWALAGLIPGTAARKFGELRGQWQQHGAIPVMPTFAPSYIDGDAAKKRIVWGDLQLVMAALKG